VLKSAGSGQFISVYDIYIGNEIELLCKKIKIYDCDQYTREFYENLGLP
jgi:hypothetical protein